MEHSWSRAWVEGIQDSLLLKSWIYRTDLYWEYAINHFNVQWYNKTLIQEYRLGYEMPGSLTNFVVMDCVALLRQLVDKVHIRFK